MNYLLAILLVATTATAENPVRILFNHGETLTTGESCDDTDWATVTAAIDSSNDRRRSLRGKAQKKSAQNARNLQFDCESVCSFFPEKTCYRYYDHCEGYRRLEETSEEAAVAVPQPAQHQLRELDATSDLCDDEIANIEAALAGVSVSANCTIFLNAPRDFSCWENPCQVRSFNYWNADTDTVHTFDFADGSTICKSIFPSAFEAVADTCVNEVFLELSGPNYYTSRTEYYTPYMVFSDVQDNIFGEHLNGGDYVLSAYGNSDASHTKSVSFSVDDTC